MAVGHHQVPNDGGGTASGTWHVYLTSNLSAHMGGIHFADGATQKPVVGRLLRQLVSAMGNSIEWCERVEDGLVIGDKPVAETLPEPDPASLELAAQEPARKNDFIDLESMGREELKALAEELHLADIDMRWGKARLIEAIEEALV